MKNILQDLISRTLDDIKNIVDTTADLQKATQEKIDEVIKKLELALNPGWELITVQTQLNIILKKIGDDKNNNVLDEVKEKLENCRSEVEKIVNKFELNQKNSLVIRKNFVNKLKAISLSASFAKDLKNNSNEIKLSLLNIAALLLDCWMSKDSQVKSFIQLMREPRLEVTAFIDLLEFLIDLCEKLSLDLPKKIKTNDLKLDSELLDFKILLCEFDNVLRGCFKNKTIKSKRYLANHPYYSDDQNIREQTFNRMVGFFDSKQEEQEPEDFGSYYTENTDEDYRSVNDC